ncbi:hypothetical protein SAMN05421831_10432 [Allopseudospirillum japonicum]|uniref:Uncharacterized protein n=1 Tax=Allopseudospirillum japonicum TaxID=64971 RepID=A0A1H6RT16_9GAMM|nr:hypothetical protein [Allopseudospirillum japonicum]SEI54685.1 hypothetical protein SAMN05421831_10432 [Allopseudospirillum japonicum]
MKTLTKGMLIGFGTAAVVMYLMDDPRTESQPLPPLPESFPQPEQAENSQILEATEDLQNDGLGELRSQLMQDDPSITAVYMQDERLIIERGDNQEVTDTSAMPWLLAGGMALAAAYMLGSAAQKAQLRADLETRYQAKQRTPYTNNASSTSSTSSRVSTGNLSNNTSSVSSSSKGGFSSSSSSRSSSYSGSFGS